MLVIIKTLSAIKTMNTWLKCILIALAMTTLVACSEQTNEETNQPMTTDRSATMRSDALGREIEQATADLASRTGLDQSGIEVSVAEFVTWSNGSIGCPQPGMNYTMALVPGYRILLVASGRTYHYHGAREREPFYCPAERAGQPLPADQSVS